MGTRQDETTNMDVATPGIWYSGKQVGDPLGFPMTCSLFKQINLKEKPWNCLNARAIHKVQLYWDKAVFFTDIHTVVIDHNGPCVEDNLSLYSTYWPNEYKVNDENVCLSVTSSSISSRGKIVFERNEANNTMKECFVKDISSWDGHSLIINGESRPGLVVEENDMLLFSPFSFLPTVNIRSVSCGFEHALLLSKIGILFSLGNGSRGQLGHGDLECISSPRKLDMTETQTMLMISCGGWHSAAISDLNDLYIWGWNESGQVGLQSENSTSKEWTPVNMQLVPSVVDVGEDGTCVADVQCGSRHTVALTDKGNIFTWGWNKYGQLGLGDEESRYSPMCVKLPDDLGHVNWIAAGGWSTLIIGDSKSSWLKQSN